MAKWLFTDFDGTLRNGKNKEINAKDLSFAKEFQNKGNKLVIVTGRNYQSVFNFLKTKYNLIPDYFITTTGGVVSDSNNDPLIINLMPNFIKNKLLNYLQTIKEKIIGLDFTTPHQEAFLFFKDMTLEQKELFMNLPVLDKGISYLKDIEIICLKIICSKEVWAEIKTWIKENEIFVSMVSNNIFGLSANEIHPQNVTKGNAIKSLQSLLSINDEDIIVAGDDENDLSMFSQFDNSFIVEQEHNLDFRSKAKTIIKNFYEIEKYL